MPFSCTASSSHLVISAGVKVEQNLECLSITFKAPDPWSLNAWYLNLLVYYEP